MGTHRFFIKHINPTIKEIKFPRDIAHQIWHVLRLKKGERVIVMDGEGKAYQVEIIRDDSGGIRSVVAGGRPGGWLTPPKLSHNGEREHYTTLWVKAQAAFASLWGVLRSTRWPGAEAGKARPDTTDSFQQILLAAESTRA